MSHQSLSRQAKSKCESSTAVEFGCKTPMSDHGSSKNVYLDYLSSPIYSYFSIAVSFFKAILYKLYNPIVTVFKDQFLQRAGFTKRLILKLFSLIAIKRLTSALKQTVLARHNFRTV